MLEAFDLCGSLRGAGELAGVSHHTVARYVAERDEGRLGGVGPVRRERIIDPFFGEDRGVGRAVARQDPRRPGLRQAEGVGVCGFGPHGAPGGRGGEGQPSPWPAAGVSAVDPRAWDVGAVGLGHRSGHRRAKDESVLCVAGVVAVPGGDRDLGPHPAHGGRLCGSGDASLRRCTDVLAHRQRAHGHDRSRRGGAGQASRDGRGRRPLRDHGGDVCAGGPRVQRRVRGDGAGRHPLRAVRPNRGRPPPAFDAWASDDRRRPLPGAPGWPLGRRPKPTSAAEAEFLALGEGARLWLVEAASAGTSRIKAKMAQAVTLARLHGQIRVDWALGHAATYARFADGDLASILAAHPVGERHTAGEDHSLQPGTAAWRRLGGDR